MTSLIAYFHKIDYFSYQNSHSYMSFMIIEILLTYEKETVF